MPPRSGAAAALLPMAGAALILLCDCTGYRFGDLLSEYQTPELPTVFRSDHDRFRYSHDHSTLSAALEKDL